MKNKTIIAITGPSGVGKTTLGNSLATNLQIAIPKHCTTRARRSDDITGFYRYLTHDEYNKKFLDKEFLISSGDGTVISKEYGNFYGVLKQDCEDAWTISDKIILFVSYKDINKLMELKKIYNVDIVNLIFSNIEKGVEFRLIHDSVRKHTADDIQSRIKCAIQDNENYGKLVSHYASSIVCTDNLGIQETYEKVCQDLHLIKKRK